MPGRDHVLPVLAMWAGVLAACGPSQPSAGSSSTSGEGEATSPTGAATTGPQMVTSGECPGQPIDLDDGGSEAVDATETGGLCADHASVDACCCFTSGYPTAGVVCGRKDLCQEIVIHRDMDASSETTACPAAIDCAVDALIAGDPGTVRWRVESWWGQEVVELHIVGDGTVLISHLFEEDLGCAGSVERKTLRNTLHFTQCEEEASALERFECVRDPTLEGVLETCEADVVCADL